MTPLDLSPVHSAPGAPNSEQEPDQTGEETDEEDAGEEGLQQAGQTPRKSTLGEVAGHPDPEGQEGEGVESHRKQDRPDDAQIAATLVFNKKKTYLYMSCPLKRTSQHMSCG